MKYTEEFVSVAKKHDESFFASTTTMGLQRGPAQYVRVKIKYPEVTFGSPYLVFVFVSQEFVYCVTIVTCRMEYTVTVRTKKNKRLPKH